MALDRIVAGRHAVQDFGALVAGTGEADFVTGPPMTRDAVGPTTDDEVLGAAVEGVPSPVLTVVVFAYRDEETISRAVRSLLTQESEDPFEVVVATSGGDRTAEIVRSEFPDVRVAESRTRLYPGGVRNLGIAMARGEVVAFLEADCIASPNWVRHRIAHHRAGHVAVAGAMAAGPSAGIVARAWLYLVHPSRLVGHEAGPAGPHQSYGLSFTREVLERTGPFDETVRSDEDTMMTERLQELDVRPWFDPSICIEHIGPFTLSTMVRDQFHRGRLDSWEEILRLPAGRLRRRWEATRWARGPFVVLRAVRRLPKRLRWIVWELRRARPEPFLSFWSLGIPMALGFVAYQVGWIDDQLRAQKPDQYKRRGELPIPAGARRRVATTGDRVVALVFIGGPSEHTGPILDVLDLLEVPTTFFTAAVRARELPEAARRITASGHTLGASGWSGHPFTEVAADQLEREVRESNAAIAEICGSPVVHVQPPGGRYTFGVVSVLQALGLQIWICPSKTGDLPPEVRRDQIVGAMTEGVTPGSVLWLSDSAPSGGAVRDALSEIVGTVRARGYRFVPLSRCPVPRAGGRIGQEPPLGSGSDTGMP